MRHQNQRGIAKSRNQFHDLFHDIRRRNSFHVMSFNIPTIKSNAVRLPGSGKFEYGNQRTGRHNPTNLVIGTLIPSSFLHRPRRGLVRARTFALRHAKRIARRRNTLQGPNVSHALPILSSFLLSHLHPLFLVFVRDHLDANSRPMYVVTLHESSVSRCVDRKYRFTLSSPFLVVLLARSTIWR